MSILEVGDLTKSYGDIVAVDALSLAVERGEIVALAGPDGAGKTSLFRALAGLIDFDSGRAEIAGHDVRRELNRIKPVLGYMPQHFSLYGDLSVEENLRFYAGLFGIDGSTFDRKVARLYEFSGLAPFSGRRAAQLSGGMKQKLALSCALVHDPELLLLDEPTTGVDPLSRRQLWDILRDLRQAGTAILVSTPYMDEVQRADRAVLIHRGRPLATGTPDQLVALFRGEVYAVERTLDAKELRQLEALRPVQARRFGTSIHLYAPEGYPRDRLREELERFGLDSELQPTPAGLEDVFVQMMEA